MSKQQQEVRKQSPARQKFKAERLARRKEQGLGERWLEQNQHRLAEIEEQKKQQAKEAAKRKADKEARLARNKRMSESQRKREQARLAAAKLAAATVKTPEEQLLHEIFADPNQEG